MKKHLSLAALRPSLLAAVCLMVALLCQAQLLPSGRVLGTAIDPTGGVVPGVAITLVNIDTGISTSTNANARGEYLFPNVGPGRYRLTAAASGFQQFAQELTVRAALSTTVDIELKVGDAKEIVEVNAPAPLLTTDSAALGTVIDGAKIAELPIPAGQNAALLIALTPGMINHGGPGVPVGLNAGSQMGVSNMSANGATAEQNSFLLDGVPNNVTAFINYMPPRHQVGEMSVLTSSVDAQYGNGGGAQVVMITKSGTNTFHGDAYSFITNYGLAANFFFNNKNKTPRLPLNFNTFGGSIGGPIKHDRTFFFFNYETMKQNFSYAQNATVPTAAQRGGDFSQTFDGAGQLVNIYDPFSTAPDPNNKGQYIRTQFPGNKISPNMINSAAKGILALYPMPNVPGTITGANNLYSARKQHAPVHDFSARVDHEVNSSNHLYGRFSWQRTNVTNTPFLLPTGPSVNLQYNTGIGWTSTLSPSTVLEVTAGYGMFHQDSVAPDVSLTTLGFSSTFAGQIPYIPSLSFTDMTGSGNSATSYDHLATRSLNVNMRQMRGRHSMKWGFQTQSKQDNGGRFVPNVSLGFNRQFTQGPNPTAVGSTSGNGIASLLLGTMASGSAATAVTRATNAPYYGAYFHDDIRVTSRLTINAGLRWDAWQPANERFNNQAAGFAFNSPSPIQSAAAAKYALNPVSQLSVSDFSNKVLGGLLFANSSDRRWGNTEWNNWSPRLGVAYRLGNKTVLRGGFGMFYSMWWTPLTNQPGYSSTTPVTGTIDGVTPVNLVNNPFPTGFIPPTGSGQGLSTLLGSSVSVYDPNAQPIYNLRWNFGVQQQVTSNTMVEVNYVGSRGHRLPLGSPNQGGGFTGAGISQTGRQYVYLPPQYLSLGSQLFSTLPNPFEGLISSSSPLGRSTISLGNLLNKYPQFTGVTSAYETAGESSFESLQLTANKRYSHGLSVLAAFTWTRAMDQTLLLNPSDPGPTRQLSAFAVPTVFTLSSTYELPFGPGKSFIRKGGFVGQLVGGWRYSAIYNWKRGIPISLATPAVLVAGQDPKLPSSQQTYEHWFNTSAFAPLPAFTLRTMPFYLDSMRIDDDNLWDMSLMKDTTIHENLKVRFRCEAMNALNHPRFGEPTFSPGTSSNGVSAYTTDFPRLITLSLEVMF